MRSRLADTSRRAAETSSQSFKPSPRLLRVGVVGVDEALVASPDGTHEDVVFALLEAGIAVYLEKPVAITGEGAELAPSPRVPPGGRSRSRGRPGLLGGTRGVSLADFARTPGESEASRPLSARDATDFAWHSSTRFDDTSKHRVGCSPSRCHSGTPAMPPGERVFRRVSSRRHRPARRGGSPRAGAACQGDPR